MNNIKCSIIFVNYNTEQLILDAISSILKFTTITYEIIVVDNNSQKGNIELLENNKDINLIKLSQNLGFGRANNKGIEVAKGDYILFINPDTILMNNAIDILCHYLDKTSNVGACGGNLYDINYNPTISFHRLFPSITNELNNILLYIPERIKFGKNRIFNYTNKPLNVAYITGADLLVRRSILNEIGPFDKRFFMYYEETELCYRIHKNGYNIVSIPNAKIQHLEGKSSNNIKLKADFVYNGRCIYYNIVYNRIYTKFANFIFFFNSILRFIYSILLNDKTGKKYWLQIIRKNFHKDNNKLFSN